MEYNENEEKICEKNQIIPEDPKKNKIFVENNEIINSFSVFMPGYKDKKNLNKNYDDKNIPIIDLTKEDEEDSENLSEIVEPKDKTNLNNEKDIDKEKDKLIGITNTNNLQNCIPVQMDIETYLDHCQDLSAVPSNESKIKEFEEIKDEITSKEIENDIFEKMKSSYEEIDGFLEENNKKDEDMINREIYQYINNSIPQGNNKINFDNTKRQIKKIFTEVNNFVNDKLTIQFYGALEQGIGTINSTINFMVNYKKKENKIKNNQGNNCDIDFLRNLFGFKILDDYPNTNYYTGINNNNEAYIHGLWKNTLIYYKIRFNNEEKEKKKKIIKKILGCHSFLKPIIILIKLLIEKEYKDKIDGMGSLLIFHLVYGFYLIDKKYNEIYNNKNIPKYNKLKYKDEESASFNYYKFLLKFLKFYAQIFDNKKYCLDLTYDNGIVNYEITKKGSNPSVGEYSQFISIIALSRFTD